MFLNILRKFKINLTLVIRLQKKSQHFLFSQCISEFDIYLSRTMLCLSLVGLSTFNSLPSDAISRHRNGSTIGTGPGNGLLSNDTKPLPEPMLSYPPWCSVAWIWEQFPRKCSKIQSITQIRNLNFENYCNTTQGPMLIKLNRCDSMQCNAIQCSEIVIDILIIWLFENILSIGIYAPIVILVGRFIRGIR